VKEIFERRSIRKYSKIPISDNGILKTTYDISQLKLESKMKGEEKISWFLKLAL
jgi:hypothetical protein